MLPRLCMCLLVGSLVNGTLAQGHQQQHQPNNPPPPNDDFLQKQDFGHLKHDIKDQYYVDLDEKKTNERELEFYNFKLHDYDNNLLLDGLELLLALNHDHETHSSEGNQQQQQQPQPTDGQRQHQLQGKYDQDSLMVDHILDVYDTDKDGYISFYEYMTVREKQ